MTITREVESEREEEGLGLVNHRENLRLTSKPVENFWKFLGKELQADLHFKSSGCYVCYVENEDGKVCR